MIPRVLLVAAERRELKYVPRREGWSMVANGAGPVLAAAAVVDAEVIVSVGLCGALAPALRVGDVVVGSSVNGVAIGLPRTLLKATEGGVASINRVAGTIDEKQRLARSGAVVVEMEAAGVLEAALKLGRPFFCVKAVSDTADEAFALDLNAARDEHGRFRVARIMGQTVRKPWVIGPELVRLKRNSGRAAKALGAFLGECSF